MDQELTQFEQALEAIPEEVKDFLYEGAFDRALTDIVNTYGFNEEQKQTFGLVLTDVICLIQSKDTLIELFTSWNFSQEKQATIAKDIDEKIFLPIIEATNYIVEEENSEEKVDTSSADVAGEAIKDPYEEIQKRFVYGTPIVRAEKKAYSLDKFPLPPRIKEGGDGMLVPPPAPKSAIDPYREKPE